MCTFNYNKIIIGLFLTTLAVCFSANAATTCNPNIAITSIRVNSGIASIILQNNGASTISAEVFTYLKYSSTDIDSQAKDSSGVEVIPAGQSRTVYTSVYSCTSVLRFKVVGGCQSDIQTITGTGYCQKCTDCAVPTPTCTPIPTRTPTPTPTPATPVCDAGGPYTGAGIICSTTPINVQLDGSKTLNPSNGGLTYNWSSNCPSAAFNNSHAVSPILSLVTATETGSAPALSCTVNLSVTSSKGGSSSCSSPLTAQACVRDCAGVINGTAVVDRCGVCNGDGQSCLGCQSVNIQGDQLAIDNNANSLRNNVLKVNKQLETGSKNANLSKKELNLIKDYIAKANAQAAALYNEVWQTTYTSFPPVVVSCTATFCVNVSTASSKAEISSDNQKLVDLAKSGSNKLEVVKKQAKRNKASNYNKINKASSTAKTIVNESIVINNNSNTELGQIPGSQSSCQ